MSLRPLTAVDLLGTCNPEHTRQQLYHHCEADSNRRQPESLRRRGVSGKSLLRRGQHGKSLHVPPTQEDRENMQMSPAQEHRQQQSCSAQRTATEDSLLCAEDSTAERGGTANLCMYLPPRRTGKTAVAVLRRAGCLQWSLPGLLSAVLPVGEWGDLPRLKSEHSSISVLSLACFCLGGGLPGMRVAVAVRRSNRMTRRHRW